MHVDELRFVVDSLRMSGKHVFSGLHGSSGVTAQRHDNIAV